MLNYKFSKRESILIAVFAIVLIGLLWYQFVYQNAMGQLASLDTQIQETQTEASLARAQLAQIDQMKEEIEEHKDSGIKPIELPLYDNTTALMARLNAVLARTLDYALSFDAVDASTATVERGCTIRFGCTSLDQAKKIMAKLEHDTFACSIDAVTINVANTSAYANTTYASNGGAKVSVSLHAMFYEKNEAVIEAESEAANSSAAAAAAAQ